MKRVSLVLLVVSLAATGCLQQNPVSSDHETPGPSLIPEYPSTAPFQAHVENTIQTVPPFPPPVINAIFEGTALATHLGDTDFFSTSQVDVTTFPFVQTGQAVFTAADGDELWWTYAGSATQTGDIVSFAGDFTITGGTGRFTAATGGGTYAGTANVNPAVGQGQFDMDGVISR